MCKRMYMCFIVLFRHAYTQKYYYNNNSLLSKDIALRVPTARQHNNAFCTFYSLPPVTLSRSASLI